MSHHSAQILERLRNAVMRPLATFPATRPAVVPGGPWTSGAHGTTRDANAAARPRSGHSQCLARTIHESLLQTIRKPCGTKPSHHSWRRREIDTLSNVTSADPTRSP